MVLRNGITRLDFPYPHLLNSAPLNAGTLCPCDCIFLNEFIVNLPLSISRLICNGELLGNPEEIPWGEICTVHCLSSFHLVIGHSRNLSLIIFISLWTILCYYSATCQGNVMANLPAQSSVHGMVLLNALPLCKENFLNFFSNKQFHFPIKKI